MRVQRLELTNFRQFEGTQAIDFAGAGESDPNTVTVVAGENGLGKTGLYRALMYCLFGARSLDQDRNYESDPGSFDETKIYLVNLAALDRCKPAGVEAKVRVLFTHDGKAYDMSRKLYGVLDGNADVLEENRGTTLHITDSRGNTASLGPVDSEQITETIGAILDPRVRDYFLFDGERIERLTKATTRQRREIARGIRNLLRIDEVFAAAEALKLLDRKLTSEMQAVSSGEYQKRLMEKGRLSEELSKLTERVGHLTSELEIAERQLDAIDKEIETYAHLNEAIEKRSRAEAERKTVLDEKAKTRQDLRALCSRSGVLLAKDLLDRVWVDLDVRIEKGEIPPPLRQEFIAKLIENGTCICGRAIEPDSQEYFQLKTWEKRVVDASSQHGLLSFYSDLSGARQEADGLLDDLTKTLHRSAEVQERIDSLDTLIRQLTEDLDQAGNPDLKGKSSFRTETLRKIAKLNVDKDTVTQQQEDKKTELAELERELERLAKEANVHQSLARQTLILARAKVAMEHVVSGFVAEVRKELQDKATASFQALIDHDGARTLRAVLVSEDYSLEVTDWRGKPFLANVSAGQRQILSLAFITALAQIAGGASVLEVPLYMDTPFSRLSTEHRVNLLRLMPQVAPQLILLVTGKEFGAEEQAELRASGRWGKRYLLEGESQGVTRIREQPLVGGTRA